MKIEVLRKSLFERNLQAAEQNRRLLDDRGITAVNVLGGAGSGKTTLLEMLIPLLRPAISVGVLEGDLATTRDAERIAALGVPVVQLLTDGGCHLTATLVEQGLHRLPLDDLNCVIIENVGNPICPTNFDLGEHHRLTVLSVAEGDDKPTKYPHLFQVADAVVISKMDLLDRTNFDVSRASAFIRALNRAAPIFCTTCREPASMHPVADWFRSLQSSLAGATAPWCPSGEHA